MALDSDHRIDVPRYFLLVFGLMAAIVPFAIDAYIPAIPSMAQTFGVDVVTMNQTISFFLIGYGIGQFMGGPLSDQLGRKVIGVSGVVLFLGMTLAILLTKEIGPLRWYRFFQAIGGGCSSVIGLASIRDAYAPHEAGRRFAVVMMIMLVMPIIAPFLGSLLLDFGWQSIFLALFTFVALTGLVYGFGIPETRVVERKRVDLPAIYRQFEEVFMSRNNEEARLMMYVFAMGFASSVLLIFVTNASYIYMEHFGVAPKAFPYYFGANVLLMMVCIRFSIQRMKVVHPHRIFIWGGVIQWLSTLAFLLYVWLVPTPDLWVTCGLLIFCVGTIGLVNPNASAVYISHFDAISGSATSLSSMTVLMMGGVSGAIVGLFLGEGLLPIASGMAICSTASLLCGRYFPKPTKPFHD